MADQRVIAELGLAVTGRADARAQMPGCELQTVTDPEIGLAALPPAADPARFLGDAAVARGLLTEESSRELTRQEMLNLVFLPGLSTSTQITDMSGRGVGMDVVKTNILRMGGMLSIASERGIGTKITITLPITLAIIRALIVDIGSRTFALPITVVREAIPYDPKEIRTIQGREVITLRGETLAIHDLSHLFGFRSTPRRKGGFIVVGSMGNRELGFVVDGLEGQEDVIIKSLGKSLASVRGFAGAADLGDQRVALVLDAPALFTEYFDEPELARAVGA
jgi:two-component system chemotaxis sensor kinase CheA